MLRRCLRPCAAALLGGAWPRYPVLRAVAEPAVARATRTAYLWPAQHRGFAAGALPAHMVMEMPALSPTMAKGNVASWKKAEGDQVNAGDVLAEIETDKATLGFDSQDAGYLAKILVPAGTVDIPVGTPLAIMVEEKADVAAFKGYTAPAKGGASSSVAKPAAAVANAAAAPVAAGPASGKMGPAARKMLAEKRLSASQVVATGARGTLTKGDVMRAVAGGPSPPSSPAPKPAPTATPAAAAAAPGMGPYEDVPHTQVRRITALRLWESKTRVPHEYSSVEASLDGVLALRKLFKDKGAAVSVNDCVIKAAALALRAVPAANARWDESTGAAVLLPTVDISVAVATDKGLYTPIVFGADALTLPEIGTKVKALADKAKAGKLAPLEFMGGTFSISNLGMFGVDSFCAIINPPQAAILAVGRGAERTVMRPGGGLSTVTVLTATLSADSRAVDGATAAQLLAAFKAFLEEPRKMLL